MPKPVVMAVQGVAFTLSIELALPWTWSWPPTTCASASWRSAAGSCRSAVRRCARAARWGNAMRWILTGEELGAAEAHRIGLVQEVVPAGQQLARAVEIAQLIAQ